MQYVILLRGINVGGKNKVSMAQLKTCLEEQGFDDVVTYINSGNVILWSGLSASEVADKIEAVLPSKFKLDSSIIKVVAINAKTYRSIIDDAPSEFTKNDPLYRYYVLFPMGITTADLMQQTSVHDGVDKAWQGKSAVYYRLPSLISPDKYKSHLNKITQKPVYKQVTMRNWATTKKLLNLLATAK